MGDKIVSTMPQIGMFILNINQYVFVLFVHNFRHGGPDILNNQDRLLQDLMSTKIKGVEADAKLHPNPIHPGVEISPRSSLRSFFVEPPQHVNEANSSIVTLSAKDSGVYSHKEDINNILNEGDEEEKYETGDFESRPATQSSKETSV